MSDGHFQTHATIDRSRDPAAAARTLVHATANMHALALALIQAVIAVHQEDPALASEQLRQLATRILAEEATGSAARQHQRA